MAFHQPTRQISQRVVRVDPTSSESESRVAAPLDQSRAGSQTWVLFPPATDAGTSTSYFSSVQDDQPTPGRSRISDLGSLQTLAPSDYILSEPAHTEVAEDDEPVEDDAELDSLDSHLPDFIHQGGLQQSTTILPGHDGLGSFRIDSRALAADMQEQMYQFERYNPRRVKRRRESLELGQLALESEEAQEAARRRRIEEWRLEHSKILLEEIQKETRRRRESTVSALTNKLRRGSQASVVDTDTGAEEAALSIVDDTAPDASVAGTEWHDQDASELALGAGEGEEAGLWSRITHKVIRDLMGIDDRLLCVLFGQALPEDLDLEADDLSSTPKASAPVGVETDSSTSWQLRVLDRIARELGQLVNQLSAHPHPGAFSTYTRVQQQPLPYAGLPVIPETAAVSAAAPTAMDAERPPYAQRRASSFSVSEEASAMPTLPQFRPTLQNIPHSRPMDIPGARNAEAPDVSAGNDPDSFTQQEWEQDLDIKLVFRYLRNRFTSSRATQPSSQPSNSAETAAARAAARVRQHHPLVHQRRKSFKLRKPEYAT
ncbi:hypothetical protein N0V82_003727 [Gnomoniopsis sp. IMI 355080]|nr:hypothetical protein N0V82_003727 [Gnomoniopsis sp. IMI 355080]